MLDSTVGLKWMSITRLKPAWFAIILILPDTEIKSGIECEMWKKVTYIRDISWVCRVALQFYMLTYIAIGIRWQTTRNWFEKAVWTRMRTDTVVVMVANVEWLKDVATVAFWMLKAHFEVKYDERNAPTFEFKDYFFPLAPQSVYYRLLKLTQHYANVTCYVKSHGRGERGGNRFWHGKKKKYTGNGKDW